MTVYQIIGKLRLPRAEHVYVQFSTWRFPYCGKVGVSVDGDTRATQIACSIKKEMGVEIKLSTFKMPVIFPYKCERLIHSILRLTAGRCYTFKGTNGQSEWYWSKFNVISWILLWLTFWVCGVEGAFYKAAWIGLLPWPMDQFLLVFFTAILQYALIACSFGLLIYATFF